MNDADNVEITRDERARTEALAQAVGPYRDGGTSAAEVVAAAEIFLAFLLGKSE